MRLGIFGLNTNIGITGDVTARLAARCEALGYDSWWAGEHVVLPSPRVAPSPLDPEDAILDPLVHLAYVAAVTKRMLLGTGIIILPQRNPLVLAKQAATLDVMSGGRLVLGIGVGYLEPEMRAIGIPMSERASRTDDHLAAMRAIWYEPAPVSFTGAHTSFAGIDANPRPVGTIPIIVGGHTPGAYRRAVEQGHGWYGFAMTPEQTTASLTGLAHAAARYTRPPELGTLEISITPNRPLTAESTAAYAAAGVDRLVVFPAPVRDEAAIDTFLTTHAALVLT